MTIEPFHEATAAFAEAKLALAADSLLAQLLISIAFPKWQAGKVGIKSDRRLRASHISSWVYIFALLFSVLLRLLTAKLPHQKGVVAPARSTEVSAGVASFFLRHS